MSLPLKLLRVPWTYRLWRPAHLRLIWRDLVRPAGRPRLEHDVHLAAVIDWLCRAQDIRRGCADAGAVSAGWSFEDGWLPGYPETSGYIIETFIAAAGVLERPDLLERANRIVDWELSIQHADGSFPGHFGEPGSRPVVFNTGQIMHGLLAASLHLDRPECLRAARRAGQWLLESQDADGCWRRNVHGGIPHVYNTRAAWALLRCARLADAPELERGGRANLAWALTQVTPSGWFRENAFKRGVPPFSHTIAYAIRGFLESGVLLGERRHVDVAATAARALIAVQRPDGWLAGAFADGWVADGRYCCLTGLAQMCIIWSRLGVLTGEAAYGEAARRGVAFLKGTHILTGRRDVEDGGVAGSLPFWGAYSRFEYPNWAAKFFADALMTEGTERTIPVVSPDPG